MIKNFKPRLYQETIFATASQKNTLVVLPTGMGKTNIFLMLAAHRLSQYPSSKVLLIGPTRPLIDQYLKVFQEHFSIDSRQMAVFTGFVAPEKRAQLWKEAKIIFSTPQGLENDIISNRISLAEVSLLGVDEAHRAVGDYSYVFIAKQYHEKARYPRIIGMTASPGSELERINEVLNNLYIEEIEVRTEKSPDVSQYMQELSIAWVPVEFPDSFREIQKYLAACFKSKLEGIKNYGYLNSIEAVSGSKKDLLGLQGHLQGEIAQGNKDFSILKSVSLAAEALKIQHGIELIETQGAEQLVRYLEQIEDQARTSKVKAVQNLVRDINFRSALLKARTLVEKGIEHPKLSRLRELVKERIQKPGFKIIVFTQYRDSGARIASELNRLPGALAELFIGQAKRNGSGLSQKEQIAMLDRFRAGELNVLVSSSVGEEGLDIPQVDCVIFYEPIPSAIRHIQRRGRTARLEKGEAIILMTKGTRDEAYRWTAHHKERRMYSTLESLKKHMVFRKAENSLNKYMPKDSATVFADYREKGSGVIKNLIDLGCEIRLERLDVADYVLSARCAVEFKTAEDFVDSLIDGRLLQQVKALRQSYDRPLLIVEGTQDIYAIRNIHPNAIRGLLAAIAVSYGVPVLQTKNHQDTANMLSIIARREQEEFGRDFSLHANRKPSSLKEQQEYVVSALPGVGMGLARPLLRRFKSVRSVILADEDELRQVEQIGEKKAKAINRVATEPYPT